MILEDCKPGDVVFFGKKETECDFEQAILDSAAGDLFHCALVANNREVYHAGTDGVESMTIEKVIEKNEPHYLELCGMNVSDDARLYALDFCKSVLGWSYNDIFSPQMINSVGEKSLYCSQLVTEAYKNEKIFPDHKMKFRNTDGEIIPYWVAYYADRGCRIPEGEPGSHPSIIRKAQVFKHLKYVDVKTCSTSK